MPHFKRVVTSKHQPYFILKESNTLVGESIDSVIKHETSWLLDSEVGDDVDEHLGKVLQGKEFAVIKAEESNIVILSSNSTWFNTITGFKAWNFLEQRNWTYYINTLI